MHCGWRYIDQFRAYGWADVVMFFAHGSESASSAEGAVFLFGSSAIVALGKPDMKVAAQRQVKTI